MVHRRLSQRHCPEDPLAVTVGGHYVCPACGCLVVAGTAHLSHGPGCRMGELADADWQAVRASYGRSSEMPWQS